MVHILWVMYEANQLRISSFDCRTVLLMIRFLFARKITEEVKTMLPGYDVRKAAQAAAFFALKQGGSINVLKLSKLLYLAERAFMERHDTPMFYDKLVSMPDGPVVSVTLNLINGDAEHEDWSKFIAGRSGYDIKPVEGLSLDALDELSKADLAVLNDLWSEWGPYDRYVLRNWTHKPSNIPEWKDPEGSSLPISHEEVFKHLKKDKVKDLVEDIAEHRALARKLHSAS